MVSTTIAITPQGRPASTDDIEADLARLEALGARRVAQVRRWWVMEAPTGQRFRVVRPQRPDFDEHANVWPTPDGV